MNFYTTILGSGAALPTVARHCSGQVVNVNGFRMLFDCGENTQTQLRVYHQKMQGAANPGGHVCDPSALAKIIKIGRDHIRYGRPGACPDLGDDLFCRDAPVPEPRCFYGHVS